MFISFLQGHLKAPQFTFKKEQFYIDDDQIAKELHKLQSILKDESLTEEQAKAYKGKWWVAMGCICCRDIAAKYTVIFIMSSLDTVKSW